METLEKKGKGSALLPFLLFIVIYLGAGLYFQAQGVEMAFYQFPSVTAMFIALLLAFCQGKGTIDQKFTVFAKGAANENVLTMLMIYILAGAFSTVASAMGGVDATVNLGLSVIPVHFLAAGVFVISAFMGTATGTSMGTISAIVPIAVGVAEKGGLSLPLFLGACVGGAMFGDNLSMISDTTIAATRTQGCQLRDKFRVNFLIALPAAIITIIVLLVVGRPETVTEMGNLSFNVIKVIPYLAVLVLALIGMNVFLVLTIGIFAAGIIGLSKWSSPVSVWADKTGRLPDKPDTEAMRLGRDLEGYVARRWMEATGKKVRRLNAMLYNELYPFAHADIDREVIGERAGLECKTTSTLDVKQFQGVEFPVKYYVQCVHYLAVTGYDRWYQGPAEVYPLQGLRPRGPGRHSGVHQ